VVRKLRQDRKWTLDDMSGRTGINKTTLSELERGGGNPRLDTLMKIAEAFGVAPEQLFPSIAQFETGDDVSPASDNYVDVSGYKQDDLPVIAEGDASPRGDVFWSKEGALLETVENRLSRPYDVSDPRAFGVLVRGDSMLPVFRPGMYLVVSPNTPVGDGDEVYVELTSGEHLVKTARRAAGGWILESANPAHEARFVAKEEIEMMHPIVWARRAKKGQAAHDDQGKRRK